MNDKPHQFMTEGIFIGYISILGYLITFAYEYGYLNYFNIPSSFIQIDLTTILISISVVAVGVVTFFWVMSLVSITGILNLKGVVGFKVRQILLFGSFVFVYTLISGFRDAFFAIVSFFIMSSIVLLFPLIFYRKQKNLEDKFLAQEELEERVNKKDVVYNYVQKNRFVVIYLYVGVLLIVIASASGRHDAREQTDFLVPVGRQNIAIIKNYGNTHIGLEFDSVTHLTRNRFVVLRDEELGVINLTKLGELKPIDIH